MQHAIDQPDEGHRQPGDVPLTGPRRGRAVPRRFGSTLVTLALAASVTACSAGAAVERDILLVSGRDDHGDLAQASIELLSRPDGTVVADVADGTLVRVTGSDAEWLEVETLERDLARGWVNDFYLRGTVHVVGDEPACPVLAYVDGDTTETVELLPSEQVELVDVHDHDGEAWVRVRSVTREGATAFLRRDLLQELPGPAPRPGVACADVAPLPAQPAHTH